MGPAVTRPRTSHACTDAGRVRAHNEDAVLELDAEQLWCVADGMGGHHHGAYASGLAVGTLAGYRTSRFRGTALARLEALMIGCHDELLRHARERNVDVIGCTLAVLTLHGCSAVASWCGDARVYRVRRGRLLSMTRDHSVGAESDDRDRHRSPDAMSIGRSALTTAIGGGRTPRLEHACFDLAPHDRFVLCTDGLNKELDDAEILSHAQSGPALGDIVASLFALYRERGARDNVGLVIVGPSASLDASTGIP